jgi:hypothetical protein
MCGLQYSTELLAPLTGLGSLSELSMCPAGESTDGLEVVCQLKGLRQLFLSVQGLNPLDGNGLLAELTQLQKLACLNFISANSVQGWHCEVSLNIGLLAPFFKKIERIRSPHNEPLTQKCRPLPERTAISIMMASS